MRYTLLSLAFVFFTITSSSQNISKSPKIEKSFTSYATLAREIAYVHLNKSTYIKGEMLGFNAYVLDKATKCPSLKTKNLYCVITDSLNTIVKQKMLFVEGGTSNNIFEIDSLFTTGAYTFKAYTNWMRNFTEPNMFIETFHVINPEVTETLDVKKIANKIDAQFLPEGGNFVDGVKTNVGVVVKNAKGYGVSGVQGYVIDSEGTFITDFRLNSLGLGKFLLFPDLGKFYTVKLKYLNTWFEYQIDAIKPKGISVHINRSKDNLALEFKTNKRTLDDIRDKPYVLTVHNGKILEQLPLNFNSKDVTQFVAYNTLLPGINIFTLFDETNTAVLERLFFNYNGIEFMDVGTPSYIRNKDSLRVSIPVRTKFSQNDNAKFSISILPGDTKSYNRHHNIISYTYLQPYLKGYIENASYYFTDITNKKKYELDNLLITQGWSSYNWRSIINYKDTSNYVYEDGITVKGNVPDGEAKNFILYPLAKSQGGVVNVTDEENTFFKEGLYPEAGDTLKLSMVSKKGKAKQPNLYLQFSPFKIPDFRLDNFVSKSPEKQFSIIFEDSDTVLFETTSLSEIQNLDEVLVTADARQKRIDKLKRGALRKVDVFDDVKRMQNQSFLSYVNNFMFGFTARELQGTILINDKSPDKLRLLDSAFVDQSSKGLDSSPLVFINDALLYSYDPLLTLDMRQVDYIVYDRFGFGAGGFRGGNGLIKIYTSPYFISKAYNNIKDYREFKFPLTFSNKKQYYVPKYKSRSNAFYQYYGVVDWIPNISANNEGYIEFSLYYPNYDSSLQFFIEGIANNGLITGSSKNF